MKLTASAKTVAKQTSGTTTYMIKSGDTLSGIVLKYHTTVAELMKLNGYKSDTIYAGKTMKVPNKTAKSKPEYHDVKSGDTVSALAKKYGSTIAQIKSWNQLDSKYTIYAGTRIRVK